MHIQAVTDAGTVLFEWPFTTRGVAGALKYVHTAADGVRVTYGTATLHPSCGTPYPTATYTNAIMRVLREDA